MRSHEYAAKLRELSDLLLSKPEFDFPSTPYLYEYFWSGAKGDFLRAVKAVGGGLKKYTDTEVQFIVGAEDSARLVLAVNRTSVCRKVQEEKWECEPLLSQEEEASIGAA